ncbi:CAAX prenyl protease 1 [Phlyctochytrium planicorne]|nr:CAAX prenyl protease 1 [Phlyctochytrium planicorne]
MDVFPYKELVLFFSITIFLWEQYLAYRHYSILVNPKTSVPTILKEHYPLEEHKKSKAYSKDKAQFAFLTSFVSQAQNLAVIIYDVLPYFWKISGELLQQAGLEGERETLQSIVFVIIYITLSTLVGIPFSLYSTFVIEERHGFNKQTLALFFSDLFKELILGFVLSAPLVSGFVQIVKWGGDNFFFYIVMILVYPTVIQPLFNKFTPLPDGSLKEKINALASRLKFPLTKIFVVDGSKRSSHSNAYFIGLFKDKRIVLFDTLLEQANEEEVLGVLGKMSLLNSQAYGFVNSAPFYAAFGFNTTPIVIGMILFGYIYQPVDALFSFVANVISRMHEFEADAFAKKLGYAKVLASGLIKIHLKNLGNVNPDKLYSAWHYSHPPLVERLTAIQKGGDKSE